MMKNKGRTKLEKYIDDLWIKYDVDNSGELDKDETRLFVQETLAGEEGQEFDEAEFEEVFADFDKDGSGTIEKDEMAEFVKELGLMHLLKDSAPADSSRINT